MAAGCPAPLADSGWPRISTTVPKKKKGANKRGKRSLAKQQKRIDRGIRKRQEAQQNRAEARFPELLGRGNSSGDTATRTVVLEDTTDPGSDVDFSGDYPSSGGPGGSVSATAVVA